VAGQQANLSQVLAQLMSGPVQFAGGSAAALGQGLGNIGGLGLSAGLQGFGGGGGGGGSVGVSGGGLPPGFTATPVT
jgi:hypothetical protein